MATRIAFVWHLTILCGVGVGLSGCTGPIDRGPADISHGDRATPASSRVESPPAPPSEARAALPPPPANPTPATIHGTAPSPTDDVPPIVVLEPQRQYAFPMPEARPLMDQIATRFTPAALIVRTGQPTDFRNDDDKLHNVRVRERGRPAADLVFNIALAQGGTYPHVFDKDGVWDVRCDVHQNMYGLVVSTSSPYAAVSTAEGTYTIADVLPGAYTAIAYTSRERIDRAVMLAPGQHARVDFR